MIIVGTIALIVLGGYGILSWLVRRDSTALWACLRDLDEALLGDLETTSVNLAGISEKIPPELLEKLSATVHSLTESLGNVIGHHRRAYSGSRRKYREKYPQYPGACDIHHPVRNTFSSQNGTKSSSGAESTRRRSCAPNWRFIMEKFRNAVGGYFKAQFKIMGVVAVILLVGFFVLHIKYAILWAIPLSPFWTSCPSSGREQP